ncbi:hypothetical protein [Mycobacterium sp. TY813]|uniref:hypothetical protein n=1 Tax=Mycobacterium TaxID=1763 RepID=UPI00274234B6|nr:hypothetical protein [Mycobacterium sp. TY813]MDP7731507.1 hypothetical protein [Mycobacterium sp. TY813]
MQERLAAVERDLLPPEYHAAQKVLAEAQQLMASPPAGAAAAKAEELNPFAIGEIQEQWIAALIDKKESEERHKRRFAILKELVAAAENRARVAASTIGNQVLVACQGELEVLLEDVAEVADELGGIRSADKAIAADLGPTWKRLCGLVDDYQEIRRFQLSRTSQDLVQRSRPSQGGEEHASDLYIKNLDDLWPEWRTGGSAMQITRVDGSKPRYEPWPAEQPRLLLWLATSRAQPWVPTERHLHELWERRKLRANPMPNKPQPVKGSRPRQTFGNSRVIPQGGGRLPIVKPIR